MTRARLVPVALLLVAALAVAAVFAVHRIERGVGPFALPYASRYFAPRSTGDHERATIRFALMRSERVTVRVLDSHDHVVRTLVDDRRMRAGGHTLQWDGRDTHGTLQPDGDYRVTLRRAGDDRTYEPVNTIRLDATPPRGWLDRVSATRTQLSGLVVYDHGSNVLVEDAAGSRIEDLRRWYPKPGTVSGTPTRRPFPNAEVVRFSVPLTSATPLDAMRIVLVDDAGNRVDITGNLKARVS